MAFYLAVIRSRSRSQKYGWRTFPFRRVNIHMTEGSGAGNLLCELPIRGGSRCIEFTRA